MVFKKKALKPKKIRAVRQPRAKASKEQHTHIINVFNTPHGTHNPYVSDMPFQDSYKVPYVFSTQKFHVPQQIEPQVLTHNVEPKSKPIELTSQNIFPQSVFSVPTMMPTKSKLNIGGELSASEIEAYQLHNNPYASESEGSPRSPRADKGKARGSYKEKQVAEGRNIQNQYVARVESHHQQQPITSFMEVKSTTGSK